MTAPEPGAPQDLGQIALGGAWRSSIGVALQIAGQMLALVLLARLLEPADFGVSAVANLCVLFSRMVPQTLFGVPLVQLPSITRAHVGTAMAGSLAAGLLCAGSLILLAPIIADAVGVPEAAPAIAILAVVFLWDACGMVAEPLLSRAFRFGAVTMIEALATFLCTGALAVALAWNGFGFWSLVYAAIAHSALRCLLLAFAARRSLAVGFDRAAAREMLRVGSGFTVGAFVNFLALHGDNFMVARLLGPGALGLYERAYRLASVPLTHFDRALSAVAFSSMARVQDDRPRLHRAFRRGMALTILFGMPMTTTLAVLGPEIVVLLFGARWTEATLAYQVLAGALVLRFAYRVSMLVILACGRTWAYNAVQVVFAGCILGGVWLTADHGLGAVAAAVAFAQGTNMALLTWLAMRQTGMRIGELLRVCAPGAGQALLLGAGLAALAGALRPLGMPLLTLAAAGLLVALWALWLMLSPRRTLWGAEGLWLRGQLIETLSRRFGARRRRG